MARRNAETAGLFDDETPPADGKPRGRRRATGAVSEEVTPSVRGALERLPSLVARLEEAIGEAPRGAEFEPLAEHLYAFAQSAPKLMESLEAVVDAVPQIEAATDALSRTATRLAPPLVEFTKVSPALAETMRDAVRSFATARETVARLEAATKAVAASRGKAEKAPPRATADARATSGVAESLESLANEIDATLVRLPKDPEYARVAEQLRELATVSPSLMDWMHEVKPLAAPLAGSVVTLRRVANTLRENASKLRGESR